MISDEAFDRFLAADLRRTTYIGHMTETARLDRAALPDCGNCYFWMTQECPVKREDKSRHVTLRLAACTKKNGRSSVCAIWPPVSEQKQLPF